MKACISDHASRSGLRFLTAAPRPRDPRGGEVLVSVSAVGLNPVDYKMARPNNPLSYDFAGKIEQVGNAISGDFKVGDRVFGYADGGAMAEYILVDCRKIAKIPDNVSDEDASALPVAGLTALQALAKVGCIGSKMPLKVLIIGASGGVGTYAVQIAKAANAPGSTVVAVCSKKNVDVVKSLGADEVLDYSSPDFSLDGVTGVDAILDTVHPEVDYAPAAKRTLKSGGRYIITNFHGRPELIRMRCDFNTPDMNTIVGLLSTGKIASHVSKSLPFTENAIAGAFNQLISRRAVGKMVVKLKE